MAISICDECRGKISTNVDICPHCGNKILTGMFNSQNVCKVNGICYDLTPFIEEILDTEGDWKERMFRIISELRTLTDCAGIGTLYMEISSNGGVVPQEFNGPTREEMRAIARANDATRPKCPTCGSVRIHKIGFGERTLSVNLFGLSSKKFNKSFQCDSCGYTW